MKPDNFNILLYDNKRISNIETDPFIRIMTFYSVDKNGRKHLENTNFSKGMYENIYSERYTSFDVINSFWTVFTCGLVIANKALLENNQLNVQYYTFREDAKTVLLLNKYFSSKWFADTYFSRNNESDIKKIVNKMREDFPQIDILASICHTIANYSPCPIAPFNAAKGTCNDVKDFLPLMIDKIEKCIEFSENLVYMDNIIPFDDLRDYKNWLINNQQHVFLDDYYDVINGKMKGKHLFDGQSLDNPLPMNAELLRECLDSIINRTYNRVNMIHRNSVPV